jgi:serine/threonine-protein kinase
MTERPKRHLAAIMFADMVGYTALMQEDEGAARAQRDQHRGLLATAVARRNGEILQHYGDGTLCLFASAVEAVECAVAVQSVVNRGSLLPLRIGIHSGDVVHDADGVYGDGVNVASRIEGLSAPGGVMVSSKVYDEIKNHRSISATPMGVVRLKKVEYRLKVYAVTNQGIKVPSLEFVREKVERGEGGAYWPVDEEVVGEGGNPVSIPAPGLGETFLQNVRDRALAQWGLVYVAAAWVIVTVVEFGADRLAWPPMVPQATNLLAFVGFFATLVLAWYHGQKGRQPIRWVEVAILSGLLVGGGVAITLLPSQATVDPQASIGGGAGSFVSDGRPSVAVLPWINRSGEEADAHFTDGIHDEILTRLSQIQDLRVISRQSVMQFRESAAPAGEIAEALGVRYLLEGGLLRAGDSVRLNVQLVDAHLDETAWAASYDRDLSMANLLAIQAEVATTIADTLQATVTPAERAALTRPETENLEAYDFYLQGRSYFLRPGYQRDDFEAAAELFARSIEEDPDFALAHASLSRVHGLMYWERFDPTEARLEEQRREAETALALQPDLPQAHVAIGWMHYVQGDFRQALEEYSTALAGIPNDAEVVANIGYTHRRLGNWPEVYAAFLRATELNPRDANLFYDLGGHSYGSTRRYAEAAAAYESALELAPDLYDAALARGTTFIHWQGQLDSLRAAVAGLPETLQSPEILLGRLELALWERDGEALLRLVDAAPSPVLTTQVAYVPTALYAAWARRLLGEPDQAAAEFDVARRILEAAVEDRPTDERILLALGFTYAGLERPDDAERMVSRAIQSWQLARDALSGLQTVEDAARVLAQAGLVDQSLYQLEMVLEGVSPVSGNTLALDPLLDPVRGDPRFEALMEAHAPSS